MKTQKFFKYVKHQAGMTLMEIIAALAIISAVVVGALSLFDSASSSQASTQLLQDITAVRTAAKQIYMGSGNYGTTSLDQVLIVGNKIPTAMTVTGTPKVINTSLNGTLKIMGATSNFTMTLDNVTSAVCTSLVTNASSGWKSVAVGSGATLGTAITTFPVNPTAATSTSACGGTPPFNIVWTTLN